MSDAAGSVDAMDVLIVTLLGVNLALLVVVLIVVLARSRGSAAPNHPWAGSRPL